MVRSRIPAPGLLLALLALVAQLAFGAVVPQPEVGRVLAGIGIICHAPAPADSAPKAPAPHRPDCVFCPLCVSLAAPGIVLPAGATPLPPLQVVAFTPPGLPPATAPPIRQTMAAQPRGPPALS